MLHYWATFMKYFRVIFFMAKEWEIWGTLDQFSSIRVVELVVSKVMHFLIKWKKFSESGF